MWKGVLFYLIPHILILQLDFEVWMKEWIEGLETIISQKPLYLYLSLEQWLRVFPLD